MEEYDYLIVGAGLFGAVCARELTDAGSRCLVVEKRNHLGGNVYTKEIEGIQVHIYGAHIFHTNNDEIWKYVRRFADFVNYINSPLAIYRDKIYNLPFNMNTFSRMWGVRYPHEAREVIAAQVAEANIASPRNLEEQAISLVGRDIYETLIRGYTEKQWGRPCAELPASIIRRIPVRFTYDNNYFNDRWQGIPAGGYTALVERMLQGVEIRLGVDYLEEKARLDRLARRIIYTGPIDQYYGYRLGTLEWRSLRFETETLDTDNYQGNAVVNYTEREIPYTRIIEHKHFEFGKQAKTVVTREYPAQWLPGAEAYYPVRDQKNEALYGEYAKRAEAERNVVFGGRLGSYEYYDMDNTIEAALACVSGVLKKG
jgi:UDP-galactopyranose mutase